MLIYRKFFSRKEVHMTFLKRHKGKFFILIFLIFTGYIIFDTYSIQESQNVKETSNKVEDISKKEEKTEINKVIVDIKGEVNTPGVYELTSDDTVMKAIDKAGGLTKNSNTSNINLSKKLEDEMVIIVYSKTEIQEMKKENQIVCPPCNDVCVTEEDEKAKLEEETSKDKDTIIDKININTSDETALQTLNGIGEAKAKAIIEYRNQNGKFKTIEDIKNVPGIGDSIYEKIKDNITV